MDAELVVSICLGRAFVGCLFSGSVADGIGRRRAFQLSALPMIMGAALSCPWFDSSQERICAKGQLFLLTRITGDDSVQARLDEFVQIEAEESIADDGGSGAYGRCHGHRRQGRGRRGAGWWISVQGTPIHHDEAIDKLQGAATPWQTGFRALGDFGEVAAVERLWELVARGDIVAGDAGGEADTCDGG
ncbi:hypothetical protein ZWY2020_040459 [Hordeum vulgare]|nr:hypothetical protein ZWY2020_040459 [Hordeum vulgare]